MNRAAASGNSEPNSKESKMNAQPARFMWNVPVGGSLPPDSAGVRSVFQFDVDELIRYAQSAEEMGIEQLLLGVGYHCADAFTYVGSLVRATKRIKFIIAYRAGMMAPTTFVQMLNSLSAFGDGRITVNMVQRRGRSSRREGGRADRCPLGRRRRSTRRTGDRGAGRSRPRRSCSLRTTPGPRGP
jgi:alkanesulfonate monooxygenase SsuD/methylene tetrahydromethanopterin reductase-like flavin-dependent oxidoreductase (luciferase family)